MSELHIDPAVDHVVVVASEHHKIVVVGEDTGLATGEDNLEVVRRHLVGVDSLEVGTGRYKGLHILVAEGEADVHILAAEGVVLHNPVAENMAIVLVEDTDLEEAVDDLAEPGSLEAERLDLGRLEVCTGQKVADDSLVEANLFGMLMHRQSKWSGIQLYETVEGHHMEHGHPEEADRTLL